MELTLAEVEQLTGVSRYQISRYAKDGRLQRTRQGHYDAASLANLHPPFDRLTYLGEDITEEKAVWLVRAEHGFRRELFRIIERRHHDEHRGFDCQQLTAGKAREIDQAVKAYVAMLVAMPERAIGANPETGCGEASYGRGV